MRAYFISQTDPYHDTEWRLEGAPSSIRSNSVIVTVNSETTLDAASFGLPNTPGTKWDMHLVCLPITIPSTVIGCNMPLANVIRNSVVDYGTSRFSFGPLTFCGVANGGTTYTINSDTRTSYPNRYQCLPETSSGPLLQAVGGANGGRPYREIARAYEVIDQTPKLYQQGIVTSYSWPANNKYDNVYMNQMSVSSTVAANGFRSTKNIIGPATSLTTASRVPGATTWDASKGIYTVPRHYDFESGFEKIGVTPFLIQGQPDGTAPATLTTNYCFASTAIANTGAYYNEMLTGYSDFNCYGSYFSGLSSEYGTLRIKLRQIFEILVGPYDQDYVPLMSPTVPKNIQAEMLIQETLSKIPATVPQTFNPKGEQWRQVLRAVAKIGKQATPLISTVSPEVGTAVGALSDLTLKKTKKKNRVKKKA